MRGLIFKGFSVLKSEGPKSFSKKVAKKILGRQRTVSMPANVPDSNRIFRYPVVGNEIRFSILTGIYEKSNPDFFRQLAKVIRDQSYPNFEWIVVAQGELSPEMKHAIDEIRPDSRIRIHSVEKNQGIIGWMKLALSFAEGDYVIPVDGDDLVAPDLLQVFAFSIIQYDRPPMLYADEDHVKGEEYFAPYFRPSFDRTLNWASSYVWHPICFSRTEAEKLGVYSDNQIEYCHDWDTVFRFYSDKKTIVHIPEILYHWRFHDQSTTNTKTRNEATLGSQRYLLERELERFKLGDLFSVEKSTIDRGALEWKIERKKSNNVDVSIILTVGGDGDVEDFLKSLPLREVSVKKFFIVFESDKDVKKIEAKIPFEIMTATGLVGWKQALDRVDTELFASFDSRAKVITDSWFWESVGQLELIENSAAVSGRVLDQNKKILGGDEIFGWDTVPRSPCIGMDRSFHGPMGYVSKPHRGDCLNRVFFLAKTEAVKSVGFPVGLDLSEFPIWIAQGLIEKGFELIFDPYVEIEYSNLYPLILLSPKTKELLNSRFFKQLNLEKKLGPMKDEYLNNWNEKKNWNRPSIS